MSDVELADRDLSFSLEPGDAKSTVELNTGTRWTVAGWMLKGYILPLVPSLLVLLLAGLAWVCAGVSAVLACLVLYGVWKSNGIAEIHEDEICVELRSAHLDVTSALAKVRRRWSWFDRVDLTPSWICLRRNDTVQLAIPRRVFADQQSSQQFADELQARIDRDSAPDASEHSLEPFPCGERFVTDEFFYSREELEQLMNGPIQVVRKPDEEVPRRPGFLPFIVLLMVSLGAVVANLHASQSRKIVIWIGLNVAFWLPWPVWKLLTPWRLRQQMQNAEPTLLTAPRCHAIGPDGFVDRSRFAQELWPWERILRIDEGQQFILFNTAHNLYLATPKRALRNADEFLQQARSYHEAVSPAVDEEAESSVPGPAFESGNPYQPPLS